jgi:hypothetical protein
MIIFIKKFLKMAPILGALAQDFLQEQNFPERNLLHHGSNYRWST